jgi:hypothetical protein
VLNGELNVPSLPAPLRLETPRRGRSHHYKCQRGRRDVLTVKRAYFAGAIGLGAVDAEVEICRIDAPLHSTRGAESSWPQSWRTGRPPLVPKTTTTRLGAGTLSTSCPQAHNFASEEAATALAFCSWRVEVYKRVAGHIEILPFPLSPSLHPSPISDLTFCNTNSSSHVHRSIRACACSATFNCT